MNVKQLIKKIIGEDNIYLIRQTLRFVIHPEKKVQIKTSIELNEKDTEVFCGYYDKDMICKEELLFLKAKEGQKSAEVCLRNLRTNAERVVASTNAWNWQQGCRLMWLAGAQELFSFNSYDKTTKNYVSYVYNVQNEESQMYPWAVYDIAPDGVYGLSLNFTRLGVMRPGYGYTSGEDIREDEENGIWICDYQTKERKKIVSENEIVAMLNKKGQNVDVGNCYINHISIAPDSNSFIFFFIEKINGKHKANLIKYTFSENKLDVLESELIVSHYCWLNNNAVIVTAYDSAWNCRYYIYDEKERKVIENKNLVLDGHPTYIGNNRIVTDTYPDSKGMQTLKIASIVSDDEIILGRIYHSGKRREEKRCDLHPKVSLERKEIIIDENHRRNRGIIGVEVNV